MESLYCMNDLNTDELSLETPIGWSSTCFDETINYYMDCNSNFLETSNEKDNKND